MARRIFVGSSKEALGHARAVEKALKAVSGIEPILWTESFKAGDITFVTIEEVVDQTAHRVAEDFLLCTRLSGTLFPLGALTFTGKGLPG